MSQWPQEPAAWTWLPDVEVDRPRPPPPAPPASPASPNEPGRTGGLAVVAIALAIAVAATSGAVIVSRHDRGAASAAATAGGPLGPTTTTAPLPSPAGGPLTISGTGGGTSQAFHLAGGLAVFHVTQQGSQDFTVVLQTRLGKYVNGLMRTTDGALQGARALGVAAGSYVLYVSADGPWTVMIEQPRSSVGQPMPVHAAAAGPGLVGPFSGGGRLTFRFGHDGASTFIVEVVAFDGAPEGLVANTTGAVTGTRVLTVGQGVHFVNVEADGAWTVDIATA